MLELTVKAKRIGWKISIYATLNLLQDYSLEIVVT